MRSWSPHIWVLGPAGRLLLHPTPTGSAPALVAAGTLVLNLAQIWGMRNPYSEGATQLGVFASLWCIGRACQTGGMRWGVLGGAWLGTLLPRAD